jgi:hypothetical protein
MTTLARLWWLPVWILLVAGVVPAPAADEIRIYTYMLPIQEDLTKFLSQNTGVQVKTLGLSGGELWARVQAEKPNIGAGHGDPWQARGPLGCLPRCTGVAGH